MIKPVGDVFMIEVGGEIDNPLGLAGGKDVESGVREGIVVGISDQLTSYGYNTYAFDKSLGDKELLDQMYQHFKQYVGKKVFWPELSESGTIIKHEGKTYAFVKWSAVTAVEDN